MGTNASEPGSADPLSLHGIVPPTVTAFSEDETVDYERTAAHARYVVDGGVHGVFPLGTNGEGPLLTREERIGVIDAVANEVGGEVPVIAGVGCPGTVETIDHARAAVDAGADGLVVVTPYYYPTDRRALLTHYRRVAEAVDAPIYIYHIPSKTGNEIDLETLDELATIPGIVGVKDSSKNIPFLGQAIDAHPELSFLSGSDSLLFPGLEIGCSGLVSAIADVFPTLTVDLYEAYDNGDEQRAQKLQSKVYRIRRALKQGPYMAGVKTALEIVGEPMGPLRSPLRKMSEEERDALERELSELGMIPVST